MWISNDASISANIFYMIQLCQCSWWISNPIVGCPFIRENFINLGIIRNTPGDGKDWTCFFLWKEYISVGVKFKIYLCIFICICNCDCVTQLRLYILYKLSSTIFCCLWGIGVTRPNLHLFQYIQPYKPSTESVPTIESHTVYLV